MTERGGTALMRDAEATLAKRASAGTDADHVLLDALVNAHASATQAIKRLDDIQAEIESAITEQADLALDTPAGAQEFQKFLIAKQKQIIAVVSAARADSEAKTALLESLNQHYSSGATT